MDGLGRGLGSESGNLLCWRKAKLARIIKRPVIEGSRNSIFQTCSKNKSPKLCYNCPP